MKIMQLPDRYINWTEAAKDLIEFEEKYPTAKTIIFKSNGGTNKLNIVDIKIKALDEILAKTTFKARTVNELNRIVKQLRNTDQLNLIEKLEVDEIFELLFLLSELD